MTPAKFENSSVDSTAGYAVERKGQFMETIQVVLDRKLLQSTDRTAPRQAKPVRILSRTPFEGTFRDSNFALRRKVIEKVIRGSRIHPLKLRSGNRRRFGRCDSSRGEVRLYQFSPPDTTRPVGILTRDSTIGYLATVTVAPITSTIRGVPSEVVLRRRRDQIAMHGEPAQRGHSLQGAAWATVSPA